jgi:hypothetical protein
MTERALWLDTAIEGLTASLICFFRSYGIAISFILVFARFWANPQSLKQSVKFCNGRSP